MLIMIIFVVEILQDFIFYFQPRSHKFSIIVLNSAIIRANIRMAYPSLLTPREKGEVCSQCCCLDCNVQASEAPPA